MPVEMLLCLSLAGPRAILLSSAAPEFQSILIGLCLPLRPCFCFTHLVEIDRFHLGPTMVSGRTTSSNRSLVTNPSLTASSISVVPFLCAVLATVVALS